MGFFLVCAAADCSCQPPWPMRKHQQLAVGKQKSFNPQGLRVGCQLGVLSGETQQQSNRTSVLGSESQWPLCRQNWEPVSTPWL